MVGKKFGELDELVVLVLVELELLFHSIGIRKTMKSWNGLFIQDCKYWIKGCSLIALSLH